VPTASHAAELLVLIVANALSTLLRFVAYRSWIFRAHTARPAGPARQETSA
jgi:hypothetical protein